MMDYVKKKFNKNNNKNFSQKRDKNPKKYQEIKLYTSIESGKYKGKKLLLPSLKTTRSTKSIVKNCVFNVIREKLKNKIFIEAFGGSASMAAEALSNEALKSYAIELDAKAYKIATANAKNIDKNLETIHANTFEILPQLVENSKEDIILYFDPPFNIRENYSTIYEKIYEFVVNLNLKNIQNIIFEHNSMIKTPKNLKEFTKIKTKKFGSTSLSFYEK